MNKLKRTINKLKLNILPLFLFIAIFTINAQQTSTKNDIVKDTLTPSQVSDTIPKEVLDKTIYINKNKKYVIGGITVIVNQTISEKNTKIGFWTKK